MSDSLGMDNLAATGRLLRVKQAAALLGVSPRTVWRMIADGQLKKIYVRRCTCLLLADVVNFGKLTTK